MMRLPSRHLCDLLVADRTTPFLFLPEEQQHLEPFERRCGLCVQAPLEIGFPVGVVRIGLTFDFDVPANWSSGQIIESDRPSFPSRFYLPTKDPLTIADGMKVFLLDPLPRLPRMTTTTPAPDRPEFHVIHFMKDLFARHMLMVVCPSFQDRIEQLDQHPWWDV